METKRNKNLLLLALSIATAISFTSCGGSEKQASTETKTEEAPKTEEAAKVDPMTDKGIGPIKTIELAALDAKMAGEGEKMFKEKCSACHKIEERYVGPALKEVTKRRTPEWIMNMILNPSEMTEKDPIAKELLAEYLSPMANQSLKEDEARKILEYFRSVDSK